ncbi:hypothetical protein AB0F52_10835 [Amycolatopsis sp. NPDC024027]|uniref:hypothetical protein n=1 Tax=Amycolatopsis sp. NPDC024027 TaxID=3154327 RepID=UPI00340546AA
MTEFAAEALDIETFQDSDDDGVGLWTAILGGLLFAWSTREHFVLSLRLASAFLGVVLVRRSRRGTPGTPLDIPRSRRPHAGGRTVLTGWTEPRVSQTTNGARVRARVSAVRPPAGRSTEIRRLSDSSAAPHQVQATFRPEFAVLDGERAPGRDLFPDCSVSPSHGDELALPITRDAGVVLATASGEIDLATARMFVRHLESTLAGPPTAVIADLKLTTHSTAT